MSQEDDGKEFLKNIDEMRRGLEEPVKNSPLVVCPNEFKILKGAGFLNLLKSPTLKSDALQSPPTP